MIKERFDKLSSEVNAIVEDFLSNVYLGLSSLGHELAHGEAAYNTIKKFSVNDPESFHSKHNSE